MASTSAPSSTATNSLLVCERLGYRYSDGQAALSDVSIALYAGSVTALVGENGSGKSTLLKLCAGRLRPSAGRILFQGQEKPPYASLGYVAQTPELDPDMTGLEHLTLMTALMSVPRAVRSTRIETWIKTWHLGPFVADKVSTYSGGMRRRLHLALGGVHAPQIWLFDEPQAGLDQERQQTLLRAMHAHAGEGGAVLVATHDAAGLEDVVSDVIRLSQGRRV